MKKLIISLLLFPSVLWAHHTRDHLMLDMGAEKVIAATQQGAEGGGVWLLWLVVVFVLLLGLVRWWKGR